MTGVLHTREAFLDIEEIWLYVGRQNPAAADRLLARIDDLSQALAKHPHLGRERPELGPSVRSIPVDDYLVFYRPIEDGIEVLRLLSAHRDIGPRFF